MQCRMLLPVVELSPEAVCVIPNFDTDHAILFPFYCRLRIWLKDTRHALIVDTLIPKRQLASVDCSEG